MALDKNDLFFTIATEGVWSYLGPEDMNEIVSEFSKKHKGNTCEQVLLKVSTLKKSSEGHSKDVRYQFRGQNLTEEGRDITLIVSQIVN